MIENVFQVVELFFQKHTGEIITGLIVTSSGLILAYFKRPIVFFKANTPAISVGFNSVQQIDGVLLTLSLMNEGTITAINIQLFLINNNKNELWKSSIIKKGEPRDLVIKTFDRFGFFGSLPGPHIKCASVKECSQLTLKITFEDNYLRKYETTYLISVLPNDRRKFILSYPTVGKVKLIKGSNNLLFLKEKMNPEEGTV